MNNQLDCVESEIVKSVAHATADLCSRRSSGCRVRIGDWTTEVFAALRELGRDPARTGEPAPLLVWPTRNEPCSSAWLFDLCWVSCCEGQWQKLERLALACEVEWKASDDHLLEDFLKLTVAVADHRLFVFSICGNVDRQFQLLQRACRAKRDFRYLAIGIPDESDQIQYRAWTC